MREHVSDETAKCWCGDQYEVEVDGEVVGSATPLDTGQYLVNLDHNADPRIQAHVDSGKRVEFYIIDTYLQDRIKGLAS